MDPGRVRAGGRRWARRGSCWASSRGSGGLAQVGAAALGPGLSTYTAALLANTAVPAWHEARRELPFVFAGSSLASASGAALLLTAPASAGIPRRMAVLGATLSLGATARMEHRLGELGGPYRSGGAAAGVARAAKTLTGLGGLVIAARARGSRRRPVIGAVGLLAGSGLERWAIFKAGVASAGDPAATVGPQRARRDARERAGQTYAVDDAGKRDGRGHAPLTCHNPVMPPITSRRLK